MLIFKGKSKLINAPPNILAISSASLAMTCYGLAIFIAKYSESKLHRLWACFNVSVGIWGSGIFMASISDNPSSALMYWKFAHAGGFFVSVLFFHVTHDFCQLNMKRALLSIYAQAIVFSVLNIFGITGYKVTYLFNSVYYITVDNWLYIAITIFWFLPVILGHVLLYLSYNKATGDRRNQMKYLFACMLVGFTGGVQHFFPVYGLNLYPYGNFLITIYTVIASYAILRHKLLDIEVIVKRVAVFAGLFAFVYGIFTIVTIIGQKTFKDIVGWNEWIATVPTVLIITVSLRPLENILTNITERFLFQKKYDYRELLRTFTNEVLTILDLQKLTDQTIVDLIKIIKLESASILLLDADTKEYRIAASSGLKEKGIMFKPADTLITYLRQSHQPLIKDKEAESMEGHSSLRDDFKRLNAQLCLPIAHHDELLGVLCLGMKKSGEEFTPEDIDILMTLARTEGIAIANAQLFDQLSKTQAEAAQREKMAVIGTLAAGINHEICNPLGIVRGQCEMFLLNLRDGIYSEKNKEDLVKISSEIMNKVIRETDRATAITKRLSGFAKPAKKTDSEEVYVEKETDEVMGLVGHDLKLSNIEFRKEFEPGFPTILADRRQIQEVLFNIIRNAAQAMDKNDGQITLSGVSANGMAIIKIVDNGSGIPKDKIGQIFNPFFTTKEPGKGTGLGLFIVRQVVERNHGTIAVDSEDGVGTTFTLTFPATAPVKAIAA